jgi:hypothetical protein
MRRRERVACNFSVVFSLSTLVCNGGLEASGVEIHARRCGTASRNTRKKFDGCDLLRHGCLLRSSRLQNEIRLKTYLVSFLGSPKLCRSLGGSPFHTEYGVDHGCLLRCILSHWGIRS